MGEGGSAREAGWQEVKGAIRLDEGERKIVAFRWVDGSTVELRIEDRARPVRLTGVRVIGWKLDAGRDQPEGGGDADEI